MGTNYYAQGKVECEQCGSKHTCREAIHLGKSSGGWKFTFAWNGGQYYKSVPEMQEWLKTKTIWDESGKQITVDEFWEMVEAKKDAEQSNYIMHDVIGSYIAEGIAARLKWSNQRRETVVDIIYNHMQEGSPIREADNASKHSIDRLRS